MRTPVCRVGLTVQLPPRTERGQPVPTGSVAVPFPPQEHLLVAARGGLGRRVEPPETAPGLGDLGDDLGAWSLPTGRLLALLDAQEGAAAGVVAAGADLPGGGEVQADQRAPRLWPGGHGG